MKKTFIFGHRNPDTDSVTSAIALSYLKNKLNQNTEPRILSPINKETAYVLKKFDIKSPEILEDVKVQIKDIPYHREYMIEDTSSIYEAYTYMLDNGITGLPIVNKKKKFLGYVSLKEMATDFIRGDFDKLNASYDNIKNVIQGEEINKCDEEIRGNIVAATYSSELFISEINISEETIVILGNRRHVIDYCIKNHAKLIILVGNQMLTEPEIQAAKDNKVNVIKTSKLSFEVAKIIGLSNYIKTILRNETPVVFTPTDYLTDFYEISNKLKHTNYPIIDKKNNCCGMLRLIDVNKYEKKEVILVDHNDIKQSVQGLNEATIVEVIDHHNIGNISTANPISFRSMIVGSTNTIVYELFKEANIDIPSNIAALMLSGILSDTLILKSPTTTKKDKEVVEDLAAIAKLDYKKYGMEMLKAGSSLDGLSIEDVVFYDYKEYQTNDINYGIGQILTQDYDRILDQKKDYIDFLNRTCEMKGFKLIALFVTDIIKNGSYVIYSDGAKQILELGYNIENFEQGHYLPGVISRKTQIIPRITEELNNMD